MDAIGLAKLVTSTLETIMDNSPANYIATDKALDSSFAGLRMFDQSVERFGQASDVQRDNPL